MTELSWASLTTPVGQVSVGASATGVAQVRYGAPPVSADGDHAGREVAEEAQRQLTEYFCSERRAFELPLDWSSTGGAQREVLKVLAESVGYG
jgi:methylated-DNA-[protein]-cysteine S-methyltransferase